MNLIEVLRRFPTNEECIAYLEKIRWNNEPVCPYCERKHKTGEKQKDGRYRCSSVKCNKNYRVTINTIFHDTKIPLQKWFLGLSLVLNAKRGISAHQVARDCELVPSTAWYMVHRIRKAMKTDKDLLNGIIEMDECYVGGKPRKDNIKKSEYEKDTYNKRGKGAKKDSVIGMVERGGKVVAKNLDTTLDNIVKFVSDHANWENAKFITDEYRGYKFLKHVSKHEVIKHKERFANGKIHTNHIENFWSTFKKGVRSIYDHIDKKYLDNYLLEFAYKYNNRGSCGEELFFRTLERMV